MTCRRRSLSSIVVNFFTGVPRHSSEISSFLSCLFQGLVFLDSRECFVLVSVPGDWCLCQIFGVVSSPPTVASLHRRILGFSSSPFLVSRVFAINNLCLLGSDLSLLETLEPLVATLFLFYNITVINSVVVWCLSVVSLEFVLLCFDLQVSSLHL